MTINISYQYNNCYILIWKKIYEKNLKFLALDAETKIEIEKAFKVKLKLS